MHSVLWASILASAGVALVVTLVVEYVAKPGLEARKDRILEDKRERRNAIKQIHRIFYLVEDSYIFYGERKPKERRPELVEAMRDRAYKAFLEIVDMSDYVFLTARIPSRA